MRYTGITKFNGSIYLYKEKYCVHNTDPKLSYFTFKSLLPIGSEDIYLAPVELVTWED